MVEVKLPDFSDMMSVVNQISNLAIEKAKLEIQIKAEEANIYYTVTSDSKYFQNGKAPSVAFVEKTWGFAGLQGELLPLRERLATISAKLDGCKLEYDSMKMAIDIWRTASANERSATL